MSLLTDLQACTPLGKYHYAFAYVGLDVADPLLPEYIRLTRAYGLSGLFQTSVEIDAVVPICKTAQLATPTNLPITWSLNYNPWPISAATITNQAHPDPRDVGAPEVEAMARMTQHFQESKDRLASANTANGTSFAITTILFDTETYNWKPVGYDGTVAAWNTALDAKYQECYDIARTKFPSASIQWFNNGVEETHVSATRSEFVPSVTGWMSPPWFTGNEPVDEYSCALYTLPETALMRETMRRSVAFADGFVAGSKVNPWVALGAGFKRWNGSLFHTWFDDWNFDVGVSRALGRELNHAYYSDRPELYAPWGRARIVVFYPQPFQAATPSWGSHFTAYCQGAAEVLRHGPSQRGLRGDARKGVYDSEVFLRG